MLKQKSLYTEYAGGKGTFKKQKLFFFFLFPQQYSNVGNLPPVQMCNILKVGFFFHVVTAFFVKA